MDNLQITIDTRVWSGPYILPILAVNTIQSVNLISSVWTAFSLFEDTFSSSIAQSNIFLSEVGDTLKSMGVKDYDDSNFDWLKGKAESLLEISIWMKFRR